MPVFMPCAPTGLRMRGIAGKERRFSRYRAADDDAAERVSRRIAQAPSRMSVR
jgi:hypothetical protein